MKGHVGIEGNELVDRLAKEAAVEDGPVVYNKIPKEVIVIRGTAVDGQEKGGSYESFFPISEEEGNTENTIIPRVNYCANRTWENKIVLI